MLQSLLDLILGCSHRRTSFPLTPTKKSGLASASGPRFGTYVACLDCGQELAYDWNEMRVAGPVAQRRRAAEVQPTFRWTNSIRGSRRDIA